MAPVPVGGGEIKIGRECIGIPSAICTLAFDGENIPRLASYDRSSATGLGASV
jgi:hypothetical protein